MSRFSFVAAYVIPGVFQIVREATLDVVKQPGYISQRRYGLIGLRLLLWLPWTRYLAVRFHSVILRDVGGLVFDFVAPIALLATLLYWAL